MTEINELKTRVEKLISKADKTGERSKSLKKLLYQQKYEVIELEKLGKLDGKYLEAYLLWKNIVRANYQPKLAILSPKEKDKLLEVIEKEIELIEDGNQREVSNELTNEELLSQLSLRIKDGRIKRDWNGLDEKKDNNEETSEYEYSSVLYAEDLEHPENNENYTKKSMLLFLKDGELFDFKKKEE